MDRVIVQPAALPEDTDILNTNMFMMIDSAFKNAALLGTNTVVAGLACTPTAPASLQVNVAVGSIFQIDEIDATAYGSLGSNTASVLKQGLLQSPATLTITPPTTSGYSQVYLVQAQLEDVDSGAVALTYYNSANPDEPYSGPGNSGTSQYTVRKCICNISLVAGVAATTGTQTTPSPSAGCVGLFAITVANSATQVLSGNIAQLASAPFFPTLPAVPADVQSQAWVYGGTDTGAANAYVITFKAGQPIPTAYTPGMKVSFKALNANTGASTINVNGLGTVNIRRASGVALSANDIVSGGIVELTYDGTNFQMANYLGSGTNTNTSTTVDIPYVADSGTQNAIVATYSPAITSLTDGLYLAVKLAYGITGGCTINVNGLGAKAVVLGDNTNPPNGVFPAGMDLLLVYSTSLGKFQIANVSSSMFYTRPSANLNIYVNASTGSDTLYDGTSATVTGSGTAGPFKTIGRAITAAWNYAPSQYTITIQVANGTYNETPETPTYAGPALIINGASTAGVVVNGGSSNDVFVVQGPNSVTIQNLTVTNSGPAGGGGCFAAISGASLFCINTASNQAGIVFFVAEGATLYTQNHTFNGSIGYGYFSEFGGTLQIQGNSTITISSAISCSAFVYAIYGGYITVAEVNPPVFVNPSYVSGPKFGVNYNAIIWTAGQGVNFFPGSQPGYGQGSTGAIYV